MTHVTDETVFFDGTLTPSIVVDVFDGYQVIDFGGSVVGANPTGLANDTTVYSMDVLVDDVPFGGGTDVTVNVTGSAAQTFTTLVSEINTDLGANATAAITADGNISITSAASILDTASPPTQSSILITDNGLLAALNGFAGVQAPKTGGQDLITVESLPSRIDFDRFAALVDLYGGVLPFAAAIKGYQTVNVGGAITGGSATGLANDTTVYTVTVVVDGVETPVSIVGSAAQTYTNLISEIDADLGTTSSVATGDLVITSPTTPTFVGEVSNVVIQQETDDLFKHLTDFVAFGDAVPGVFNFLDAMYKNSAVSLLHGSVEDASYYEAYHTLIRYVGVAPAKFAEGPIDSALVYLDSNQAAHRFYNGVFPQATVLP